MRLSDEFDSVVMLTWSDWKTEPRSNRYHFATRFAKELPVFFVQPGAQNGEHPRVEKTEIPGLEIVLVAQKFGETEVSEFLELLRLRRIRRPLLWIYNAVSFQKLIEALPLSYRVYHATEDYFHGDGEWGARNEKIVPSVIQTLSKVNMLIAVTEGVLASYQRNGGYKGPAIVIENGCDANFFLSLADQEKKQHQTSQAEESQIAIYQGGINYRLDFELLTDVVGALPEWHFWFCGRADQSIAGWRKLKSSPNVHYLGELDPAAFGVRMCQATVGLIPYHQDDYITISLPLKAYEYVACGLPVVTVPIDALREDERLFSFAKNADEFVESICNAIKTRRLPELLKYRREAALCNSYDERFNRLLACLLVERQKAREKQNKLNVVVLYDDRSLHINTIREHVESFRKYSQHSVHFVPATHTWPLSHKELARQIDLSLFDVLIVHYSVRISLSDHLAEGFARQIERHMGLKILFIQDEYDCTETARCWMERLQFDVVYTCVPIEGRDYIYPTTRFTNTDFLTTLTGYVPEDVNLDIFAKPMQERSILIGYRGRKLPYVYGALGYEKFYIGVNVRLLAAEHGIAVDIETDDSKRIYGTAWYQFLGSVRATLGTESGSNLFDFDGTLQQTIQQVLDENPGITFDELHRSVLAEREVHVAMNQISPKIFEAIRLRTALVLFEGSYSGVVEPDIHYILLKKDFSNIADVFGRLQDIDYLVAMTTRAYDDVIASGKYSYQRFMAGVDNDINARVIRDARYELFATPVLARNQNDEIKNVVPTNTLGYALSSLPLGGNLQREQVAILTGAKWIPSRFNGYMLLVSVRRFLHLGARRMWLALPDNLRKFVNTHVR